jgi:hypothetical protein
MIASRMPFVLGNNLSISEFYRRMAAAAPFTLRMPDLQFRSGLTLVHYGLGRVKLGAEEGIVSPFPSDRIE